jgi:KUP system potassium uptake protein
METAAAVPRNGNGHGHESTLSSASFWTLTIGSIGVVYGDIGTSPLYAFREAVMAANGGDTSIGVSQSIVFGILSLILWTLFLIVTAKYVLILLRADNNGEGGTLSLMALAQRAAGGKTKWITMMGIMAASLFYGDAVITPAISVISAVEGINVITPAFKDYVVPITIIILIALFTIQYRGTGIVAQFFGPIMVVWLAIMATVGFRQVAAHPSVLEALNPWYGLHFLTHHGIAGFHALGAVFLAVTGAEALYADLGHFGRRPIQWAWLGLVLPALAINYLGQGALVLADPKTISNPFFLMVPEWALLPVVLLATMATVIASQAVITGAYSMSRQAIQLGLLPRFQIRHTSESQMGQIYMPRINLFLLAGVLPLVAMFRTSSGLASAYGIAVTGTMIVTAGMAFVVIWKYWKWPLFWAAGLILPFFIIESAFLFANLLKVTDGGWAPLLLGAFLMLVMLTWVQGSRILFDKTRKIETPLGDLVRNLETHPPHRVPGTAVFLTGDIKSAPSALLHNLKHNKVLHERNVILTIKAADTPRVPRADKIKIEPISGTFYKVMMTFGYMETPSVPKGLALCRKQGMNFDLMSTSFFLSRRSVRPSAREGMPLWRDKLFIALARNADDATDFFQIPTDRVVEVGTQVTV